MVEETYISNVFSELELRCNRICVVENRRRLKRRLNTNCPNGEYALDATLPPTLDEAQVAFTNYNCAIFTAFRGGFTLEENIERNNMLRADMERLGLNHRPVDGCYKEAEMEHVVKELCFFVVKTDNFSAEEFFTHVYRLSEKYEQDCFLYKREGFQRTAFLVATTDNGRKDLCCDVKFAGHFFEYVYDVGEWTACSDGRFAFIQKGILQINTSNKKIKLSEGNIFDVNDYNATGLAVIRRANEQYIKEECKKIEGQIHVSQHLFRGEVSSPEYLHKVVFECLKELRDNKCKRIGFHCSAVLGGSAYDAAAIVYDSIQSWSKRYDKKFEWIVIDDPHGQYAKLVKDKEL